ncbi:hypothetical protein QTO34_011656 [Cnephaeus nilssonii]|uniref:Uncharacterized protein n=1 Tax=Cnephaeus nilssonii TaxID=3371016 RepID=A0AA40HF19_CNENI|nr:hypothetical protein QTO34_011656 [Eptesicus nilssonii]
MFLGPQNKETGRVYVYLVGQQSLLTLQGTLHPEPPQDARLGFAMAALPDLNHDGFADVAVGAPLEDGHRGALYLYHGTRSGVRPRPAQRIAAISMPRALSYFGRSVDGRLDLDGDDLVDVAVGAQGAAILLRRQTLGVDFLKVFPRLEFLSHPVPSSRPIVRLAPSLVVSPPAISVVQRDCVRRGQEAACLSAVLCFRVTSRTPGRWDRRLHLQFTASLDEWTAGARAAFDSAGQRLAPRRLRLTVGTSLDTSDYLRPVALTVTFALDNTTKPGPVLDEGSPTSIRKLVSSSTPCPVLGPNTALLPLGPPLSSRCPSQRTVAKTMNVSQTWCSERIGHQRLQLLSSALCTAPRKDPFVVQGRRKVLVTATLENRKENAYNTSLSLSFSRNLHLASFTPQGDRSVKVECAAPSPHARLCVWDIPSFRLEPSNSLERNGTLHDNTAQTSAYIQYEPHLLFSSESTMHRYEVHPYGTLPVGPGPEFKTTLRVQNLGCYVVSGLVISAFLPAVAHGGNYFLSLSQVITHNASCAVQNLTEPPGPQAHPEELRHTGRLAKFKSLTVVSTFELGAEEGGVLQLTEASRWSESLLEVIQTRPVLISLWVLIGSVLGGLLLLALLVFCLWKLGFFARKKIPEEEKREEKLEQ